MELGDSAMAHGGARPCPGAAGPALVVAFTLKHLHVMEKTKRELRKEEGNGAVLATVRSPAWPWRSGVRMVIATLPKRQWPD